MATETRNVLYISFMTSVVTVRAAKRHTVRAIRTGLSMAHQHRADYARSFSTTSMRNSRTCTNDGRLSSGCQKQGISGMHALFTKNMKLHRNQFREI